MTIQKETIATLVKVGRGFTTLDNHAINEIGMADALAIWVYLSSKPITWQIVPTQVQSVMGIGRRRYGAAMARLREIGLVFDQFDRDSNGVIVARRIVVTNLLPDRPDAAAPYIPETVLKEDSPYIPVIHTMDKPTLRTTGSLLVSKDKTSKEREEIEKREGDKHPTRTKKPVVNNPPTHEEVREHMIKKGLNGTASVLAEKFVNYYTGTGWVYGKSHKPMKCWKSVANNWIIDEKASQPKPTTSFGANGI